MKDNQVRGKRAGDISSAYAEIPKRLREYYDSLQEESIPDRFLDLLEKLDLAEQAAKRSNAVEEFK